VTTDERGESNPDRCEEAQGGYVRREDEMISREVQTDATKGEQSAETEHSRRKDVRSEQRHVVTRGEIHAPRHTKEAACGNPQCHEEQREEAEKGKGGRGHRKNPCKEGV